jgi:lipopolysaccharide heptosyltransferase II
MIKIRILKKLDSIFGPLFVAVSARLLIPAKGLKKAINSILFIRPGGIGDAVLLIPAIQALRKKFPQATIHILSEKRNSAVFALYPDIQKVYHYDRPIELLTAICSNYDVVIDTEQWHRLSALVARAVKAPQSIGFATNERKKLFTHRVPYSHDIPETISFLNLIEPLVGDVSYDPCMPFLNVPEKSAEKIELLLKPLSSSKIVSLFPGGSIREKRWGGDRFHRTAEPLSEQGYGIVVVGGKDNAREGETIIQGIPGSLNLCGKLSLPETAAVLKRSSLLITGDSGIMHIGYGLGVKIVALFGPGNDKKWAPLGKRCTVITKNLACSPCSSYGYTKRCRDHAACMSGITVEEVVHEALVLLEA